MAEVSFWQPLKTVVSYDLFIIINNHHHYHHEFLQRVFSESTEVIRIYKLAGKFGGGGRLDSMSHVSGME